MSVVQGAFVNQMEITMLNRFKHVPSATAPATVAYAITPDDGNNLPELYRALYIGAAGDLACQMSDDSIVSFTAVPAGSVLPVRVKRVLDTGTTAGNIVGLS